MCFLLWGNLALAFASEPLFFQTPTDKIPNYAAQPTCKSTQSGNWSSPATWDCSRVPGTAEIVKVDLGHTVIYDQVSTTEINTVGIEGKLEFPPDADAELHATTIIVYRDGWLQIGTQANPIQAGKTVRIVFNDELINTTNASGPQYDPSQYGHGYIILGRLDVHGEDKGDTWQRLTADLLAGQTTMVVSGDISKWSVGDRLVLPDSEQKILKHWFSSQPTDWAIDKHEVVTITSIGAGNTIHFTPALQYDHKGVAATVDTSFVKFPHVSNLTRNVIFQSEAGAATRAHGMYTERARVDVRYSRYYQMGRTLRAALDSTTYDGQGNVIHVGTNQIGRYGVHAHQHMGPVNPTNTGYQGVFVGNTSEDNRKWGPTWHNAHGWLIENNVCYLADGSCYMTEDGNERWLEFIRNSAVKVGNRRLNVYKPVYGGVGWDVGVNIDWENRAYEGSCFWFTGLNITVKDNIAGDCEYAGIMFNARLYFQEHQPLTPDFLGATIGVANEWTQTQPTEWAPSAYDVDGNEVYACADCVWISFSGVVGDIKNMDVWNFSQSAIYSKRNNQAHYTNFRAYNDYATTILSEPAKNQIHVICHDLHHTQYRAGRNSFDGGFCEGAMIGTKLPVLLNKITAQNGIVSERNTLYENFKFKNYVNAKDYAPYRFEDYTSSPKQSEFINVTFETITGYPAISNLSPVPADIDTYIPTTGFSRTDKMALSEIIVRDFNGVQGDDFKVYFREQSPDYVIPTTGYAQDDCPTAGLTNQQCWNQHGKARLGEVAPCVDDITRPTIDGYTCPIGSPLPPPPPPTDITVTACADATLQEGDTLICNVDVSGGTGTGRTYLLSPGSESGTIPDGATSFQFTRSYTDGNYSENIAISVDDDGDNNGLGGVSVTVNNISPAGAIVGTGQAVIGQGYTVTIANLTDPGDDTIAQYVLKVSGKPDVVIPAGNPLTYTFDCAGVFDLEVYADDEDGQHHIGTHQVTVNCECLQ